MKRDDPRLNALWKFSLSLLLGLGGFTVNRIMPGMVLYHMPLRLFLGEIFPLLTALAWGPVYSLPAAIITSLSHFFLQDMGVGAAFYLFISNTAWYLLMGRAEEKRKWSGGNTLGLYFLLLRFALANIGGYLLIFRGLTPEPLGGISLLILSYQDNISHLTSLNLSYIFLLLPPLRTLLGLEKLPRGKLRSDYLFLLSTIGGLVFFFLFTWGMQVHLDGIFAAPGSQIILNLLNLNIVFLLAIVIYMNWDLQSDISRRISERGDILITLLSNISEGILIMDGDWKIRFANTAAFRLGPYSRKDLGARIDRIVQLHSPETGKPLNHGVIIEALQTGKAFTCLLARRDGTFRRIVISLSVLPKSRSGYAFLSLIRDITEEYEQEQKNIHRQKQEAIGRLVGGVAHDFNNRLAGIMGFAQLITQERDCAKIGEYAEQIVEGAQSAADLTSQLLTISRKKPIQNKILSLNALVEGMLNVFTHTLSKGVEIRYVKGEGDPHIRGDKSLLENSLLNLAINGSDAMKKKGVLTFQVSNFRVDSYYTMKSRVSLAPGEYGRISVADTGSGIPPELRESIFDPFFTTKQEGEGTGLGLSSVREIVEKHRGEITVHSTPGKGSTFTILLPLAQEERA